MVKYVISDDEIYNIINFYEQSAQIIQGFKYGAVYVIRDLRKCRDRQEIWRGYEMDELQDQLKLERARYALRLAAEKIVA